MKTKVLIIAGLICAGMIFTSCEKDNALTEDTNFEQLADSPKAGISDNDENWEDIGKDPIYNLPDPFTNYTTIHYKFLPGSIVPGEFDTGAWVRLTVSGEVNLEKVIVLVNEYQKYGEHMAKFNASGLPSGKYIAELRVGSKVFKQVMTKKPQSGIDFNSPVNDID